MLYLKNGESVRKRDIVVILRIVQGDACARIILNDGRVLDSPVSTTTLARRLREPQLRKKETAGS